jgi:hypothetical protein
MRWYMWLAIIAAGGGLLWWLLKKKDTAVADTLQSMTWQTGGSGGGSPAVGGYDAAPQDAGLQIVLGPTTPQEGPVSPAPPVVVHAPITELHAASNATITIAEARNPQLVQSTYLGQLQRKLTR